jgi:hypothetical protein
MEAIKASNFLKGVQLTWVLLFTARMLLAQGTAFKPLRYEEDNSKFKNDSTGSFYKKIKYMVLDTNRCYLSLGGEVRYQYFNYKNAGWGTEPEDRDGFVLSRLLSHADLHIGKHVRIFSQIQSSLIAGSIGQNSAVDENPLDVHQLFIDLSLSGNREKELLLKLGRQELSYGAQRLISVREGPNNRQAFDALRIIFKKKRLRADAFYSTYVNADKNVFDERFFDCSRPLWGTYLTLGRAAPVPNLDLYYLGVKNKALFVDAKGSEKRHSVGARLWRKEGVINYDFEAIYQFGTLARSRIKAWTVSLNVFSEFEAIPFSPVFGLKTELISGDRTYEDLRINTFNPLYPRGAYFGLASLIGPYNLTDLHPYLEIDLGQGFTWAADLDFFWRVSRNDGLYAVNGDIIHDGRSIHSKNIGNQLGTDISVQVNPYLYFQLEFTWFDSGKFLHQAGMAKDIYMAGVTTTFKF